MKFKSPFELHRKVMRILITICMVIMFAGLMIEPDGSIEFAIVQGILFAACLCSILFALVYLAITEW